MDLLIAHIIVTVIIFIITIKKEGVDSSIYKTVLCFFIPVFGFLFIILSLVYDNKSVNEEESMAEYLKYIKNEIDKGESVFRGVDLEKELNVVPIEEALIINKDAVKRQLVIDVFKEDVNKYINILKITLKDKDSETSHYAASAIMELNRWFGVLLKEAVKDYQVDPNNIKYIRRYADIMQRYLKSGLLNKRTENKYINIYRKILVDLLGNDKTDSEFYIDKINYEIEAEDYETAKEYCLDFYINNRFDEDAYIMYIKLFYEMKDKKNMINMIRSMQQSPLDLSDKAKSIVGFWEKRSQNA